MNTSRQSFVLGDCNSRHTVQRWKVWVLILIKLLQVCCSVSLLLEKHNFVILCFSLLCPSLLHVFCCLSHWLSSQFFFPFHFCSFINLPSPAGTVYCINIWRGYWVLEGLSKTDQQRRGCSCWGLAACFFYNTTVCLFRVGAAWANCKLKNHDFLKYVWVMELIKA